MAGTRSALRDPPVPLPAGSFQLAHLRHRCRILRLVGILVVFAAATLASTVHPASTGHSTASAPTLSASTASGARPVRSTALSQHNSYGLAYGWAGYVSTHAGADMAYSRWIQPYVTCNEPWELYAAWVGLDGYGGTGRVEQTGVTTDCSNGFPSYYGWYEYYPDYAVNLSSTTYPIEPGDLIEAGVQYAQSNFYLTLKDLTQSWIFMTQRAEPNANPTSAEIVVEAQHPGHGYPDFGTIYFLYATLNYGPVGDQDPIALDATYGGQVEAQTNPIYGHGTDFSITYKHE
jgi:hypothetical protein